MSEEIYNRGELEVQNRLLLWRGLSCLVYVTYSDPVAQKRLQKLRDIFSSVDGKLALHDFFNIETKEKSFIFRLLQKQFGFRILKAKLNRDLLTAFSDTNANEITTDLVINYLRYLKDFTPDIGGFPQGAQKFFVRIYKAGFFREDENLKKFFESCKMINEKYARTGNLFAFGIQQLFLGHCYSILEKKQISEEEFLSKLSNFFCEDTFNKFQSFYQNFFKGQDPEGYLMEHKAQFLFSIYLLTDLDTDMLNRLNKFVDKTQGGKDILQSIFIFNPNELKKIRPILAYSKDFLKIFHSLLHLKMHSNFRDNTSVLDSIEMDFDKIQRSGSVATDCPNIDFELLERRKLYKKGSEGYENLTREFARVYFGYVRRKLESEFDKLENKSDLSDIKIKFMYYKLLSAMQNDVSPYPTEIDIVNAKKSIENINSPSYRITSPENAKWAKRMFGEGKKGDDWLRSSDSEEIVVGDKKYFVGRATDTKEIIMLGELVNGSCYRADGVNYWNSFPYVLDANKLVFYIKNENGDILARFLAAVDENKNLVVMGIYSATPDANFYKVQLKYIKKFAQKYKLGLGGKVNNVARLNFSRWIYDEPLPLRESILKKALRAVYGAR